jgi:hypothetical protein
MSLSVRASLKAEIKRLRDERDSLASELLTEREKLEQARGAIKMAHKQARDVAAWLDAQGGARLIRDSTVKVLGIAAMLRAASVEKSEGST